MTTKNLAALAMICLLCSCQKDDSLIGITGDYSYKTSGEIISFTDSDTLRVALPDEVGTLDIVPLHENGNILLTFNTLGGSAYSTFGTADGDDITFEPFNRTLRLGMLTYDISVEGTARRYDGTILFSLTYEGQSQSFERKLESTSVQTIAKRN